ncbi:MAG TPA: P-loop NTPase fold protein [Solirubrobacteraceae bacterium]|nr:P-loop NTPase fold protein [Solirubrobacteraceae bacterium]
MTVTMPPTAAPADASTGRRVPLVADAPLDDPALDRFGFAEFAHALTLIVDDDDASTPLTIAISAPWGGGKSSLGRMLETMLEQRVRNRAGDDERLVCWFNAWEHDDAPHLGAALAASVARAADRNRSWWRRAVAPLPTAMLTPGERSRQAVILGLISAALGLLVALAVPSSWLVDSLFGDSRPAAGAGALGVLFFAAFVARRMFTTAREAARFVDDPRSTAARGTMSEVKSQFGRLIRHATHKGRLIIIVDDLERCTPARALEVCQVASQLLAQPGVVTILLADMEPIARSAGARYAEAMPTGADVDAEEIGRRYLAKIVQLEIALPPPVPEDMRRVIRDYGPSLRHALPEPETKRPSGSRRLRITGIIAQLRWWPLLAWLAFAIVYGAFTPGWWDNEGEDAVSVLWTLLFFPALALGFFSWVLRRRARKRRQQLKEQIEELKGKQLSPEEVASEVLNRSATSPRAERLISDLVSSSFLDSDEFRAVEMFISEHPPALPREAKRSFNHAQLLTEIARARHMFGGEPVLTPRHLAKWLVLREQWPALGRAIALEPELLAEYEATRTPSNGVSPEALELLTRDPPLRYVIERLVYFQPADKPPR